MTKSVLESCIGGIGPVIESVIKKILIDTNSRSLYGFIGTKVQNERVEY